MKNTLLISTMLSATAAFAETPVLTVYAPDYFASEWGPGPAIETEFEKACGCDLQFSAGDLLPRIMLEGSSTDADIVIGLNTDVPPISSQKTSSRKTGRIGIKHHCSS